MRSIQVKHLVWLSMYILIVLILSINAFAVQVSLIRNTGFCHDCETIYQICKNATMTEADSRLSVSFRDEKSQLPASSFELHRISTKEIIREIPGLEKPRIDLSAQYGIKENSDVVQEKEAPRIQAVTQTIEDYQPVKEADLSDELASADIGDCWNISVKGTLGRNQAVDNILRIGDQEFSTWAWWNSSYPFRYYINCSGIDSGTPIVINGSAGFVLPGDNSPQIVWTNCAPALYLYFNNSEQYDIGTETQRKAYEVEVGNRSSFNISDVWDGNYTMVYHMSSVNGSQKTEHLMSLYSAQIVNIDCKVGNCLDFANTGYFCSLSNPPNVWGTVEVWEKSRGVSQFDTIFAVEDAISTNAFWGEYPAGAWSIFTNNAPSWGFPRYDVPPNTNLNLHQMIAYPSIPATMWYINGTNNMSASGIPNPPNGFICLGEDYYFAGSSWDGTIDEFRLSNVPRGEKYVNDTWANYESLPGAGNLMDISNVPNCTPLWACSQFAMCNISNFQPCLTISDLNVCGFPSPGNESAYTKGCTYSPPAPSDLGDFKDLHSMQGVIFFFILVFLWLALLIISFLFRNFAVVSLFWLLGVLMGLWIAQVGYLAAIGFLLLDTAIFFTVGRMK